jgi:hypothetical protein
VENLELKTQFCQIIYFQIYIYRERERREGEGLGISSLVGIGKSKIFRANQSSGKLPM